MSLITHTTDQQYDEWLANLSLQEIEQLFNRRGCTQVLVKSLAARQDNDKNQIYVGGDLNDVAKIPSGAVEASTTDSRKPGAAGKTKFTAPVCLKWITADGDSPAPHAKFIFYPQYPEVRLSGLIQGSPHPPRSLYSRRLRGQESGRKLLLGIDGVSDDVWALMLPPEAQAGGRVLELATTESGVFRIWDLEEERPSDGRATLLEELAMIHELGWVQGQRLKNGELVPYQAQNAGGYTLEALLGVAPNGRSEPDFRGWELKAHSVRSFSKPRSGSPLTLMTPEPTAGVYKHPGIVEFMHRYGRQQEGRPSRVDFTGRHFVGRPVEATGLTLLINGWDGARGVDPNGAVELRDLGGALAAAWEFDGLMTHWKRKHTRTCYVPYIKRVREGHTEYWFGPSVLMCERTGFLRLLEAFDLGHVFYDPGVNMKFLDGRWRAHRRSQFRVSRLNIGTLYESAGEVKLDVGQGDLFQ